MKAPQPATLIGLGGVVSFALDRPALAPTRLAAAEPCGSGVARRCGSRQPPVESAAATTTHGPRAVGKNRALPSQISLLGVPTRLFSLGLAPQISLVAAYSLCLASASQGGLRAGGRCARAPSAWRERLVRGVGRVAPRGLSTRCRREGESRGAGQDDPATYLWPCFWPVSGRASGLLRQQAAVGSTGLVQREC